MGDLSGRGDNKERWMATSDLMAGLMMVFLLIAVATLSNNTNNQLSNIKEVVADWHDIDREIYKELNKEFKKDFLKWDIKIEEKPLRIVFNSPDILFETGKSDITNKYKAILSNFMPRLISLLKEKFDKEIKYLHIDGHTSSEWGGDPSKKEAYIKNMALSQKRAISVLEYSLQIPKLQALLNPWVTKKVISNGFSSVKNIKIKNKDIEDKERSRRVEFVIRTKQEEKALKILEETFPRIESRI